jgi:phosphoadenosine phosphosulfate reductase
MSYVLDELQHQTHGMTPQQMLAWTAREFAGRVVFATSLGREDQALTHMLAQTAPGIPVFTLDTGRLFPETYDLLDETRRRYHLDIRVYFPAADAVETFVNEHGSNGFRRSVDLRRQCCRVRKIEPLRRALNGYSAWICGLRREQSVTRAELEPVEWDEANGLIKINPLADWSEAQVWAYIREQRVPYSVLHDRGFASIGCACCTRAIQLDENLRAGRWWWETPEKKECGLHWHAGKQVGQVLSAK